MGGDEVPVGAIHLHPTPDTRHLTPSEMMPDQTLIIITRLALALTGDGCCRRIASTRLIASWKRQDELSDTGQGNAADRTGKHHPLRDVALGNDIHGESSSPCARSTVRWEPWRCCA